MILGGFYLIHGRPTRNAFILGSAFTRLRGATGIIRGLASKKLLAVSSVPIRSATVTEALVERRDDDDRT